MSYPTGMGNATGSHFNNVAAQMQSYLNQNKGHGLQSAHGGFHQHQATNSPAYASQYYSTAAPTGSNFGIDPVIASDIGGFARKFMRNMMR